MTNQQSVATESGRHPNILELDRILHQSGDIPALAALKEQRKRIDALLRELSRQEQEERNKQSETAEKPPEKPTQTAATASALSVATEEPPPQKEDKKEDKKAESGDKGAPVSSGKSADGGKDEKKLDFIRGIYVRPTVATKPKPAPESGSKKLGEKPRQSGDKPFAGDKQGAGGKPSRTEKPTLGLKNIPKIEPTVSSKEKRTIAAKQKDHAKAPEDKKAMTKRTLIRKGYIPQDVDEERAVVRKLKTKKAKDTVQFVPSKVDKAVINADKLTVKDLSEKIGRTVPEIIKQLMVLGTIATINDEMDFTTMELVAGELGVTLELRLDKTKEEQLEEFHEETDAEENLVRRPPVVTVMGHVDHGKTSLLDAIRKTSVASGEAGGITQHIGAYSVSVKGDKITFLDTPGHEAFTAMRARGAAVTDIAVLIVAADDGVMPQTVEAINHAKNAKVPIIVAINKIDKPGAKVDQVKRELIEYELLSEEWGGDVMMIPLSAKTGQGIDKLLENILFLAEYNNYRANPNRKAKGTIIEAKLDKGKGPIANVIVTNGTLKVGDYLVSGTAFGKVRALVDDKGRNVKEAEPSMPVSVLGFTEVPSAGDGVFAVNDERMARAVIDERINKIKKERDDRGQTVSLADLMTKLENPAEKEKRNFNLVIKADVQGSVEALKASLLKLENEDVKVNVVHGGVGAINKSDLMLAEVSDAMIIGFNVRPDGESKSLAESMGLNIRLYSIIYEVIDDVEKAIKGLQEPKFREVVLGRAQVRTVFKISGVGTIAGSFVLSGKVVRGAKARIFRGTRMIFEGEVSTLKRFKDDAKEVAKGYECGINISDFGDYVENDEIEVYEMEEVKA